jgi:hypothetical protein
MYLKRGLNRIFVAIAILWFISVAMVVVAIISIKEEAPVIHKWEFLPIIRREHRLDDVLEINQLVSKGIIKPEETNNMLGMRVVIRNLQECGKLPPDPNLFYKPPSFWQSEEGEKFIQQANAELLRKWEKENIREHVKVIFTGFLFWAIPLILIYLMGVLVWWIVAGFSSKA